MTVITHGEVHHDECSLRWWHRLTCIDIDDQDTGFWPRLATDEEIAADEARNA